MNRDNVTELPVAGQNENSGLATCDFCGQTIAVDVADFESQADADRYATRTCDCEAAVEYQKGLAAQERAKQVEARRVKERAQAMERAANQIEDLFGKGAPGYGLLSAIDEVKALLLEAAGLVYDWKIKDLTISVNPCVKAKVSRSAKGKIVLNRSDVAAFKQEV